MATWWVETKPKREEPLFLEVGFPGPHPPYDPVPRYAEPYMERELPLPEFTEEEIASQPPPFQAMRVHNTEVDHDSIAYTLDPTPEQLHRQRAYYMANVTMIDEKIGQFLKALDAKGYLEDAVVIFSSDHGDCLSDHGHSQKWTMYDIITRTPLIVWAPGRFAGGKQIDTLCQQMDIGPAILELAGVPLPETMEAQSLLPALEGKPWEGREYVFAEHARDGILQETEFMTMVRSREWKLVHFLGEPFGQLFNLVDDPGEIHNLWDAPAHAEIKREMLDVLREWRIASAYHTANRGAEWR
jgi:arylsulfatase A-like enzyme